MKRLLSLLFFVSVWGHLYAQTNEAKNFEARPTSLYEVMRQRGADTLVFFYNDRWQLVKPVCGTLFRVSRMDTVLLTFTGRFVDYYAHDSTIAVEGTYAKGKKEGLFTVYFPNGQIAQSGQYVNDRKSGTWEYFYEDGKRHQVLDFRDGEILVKEFWNEEGKKLVESGNGEWFGYESSERFMKTSGAVLNGRKNGTWKNTIPSRNLTTNIEKYKEGVFLSGKRVSMFEKDETYKDTFYCALEKAPAFLMAEQFQMTRCYQLRKNNWEYATYPGGMDRFFGQIRQKIVFTGPMVNRGVIKVQTTIDTEGKMTNFKPVSNTGHEWDLIEVLETLDNWRPMKINGKPTIQPKIISLEIM